MQCVGKQSGVALVLAMMIVAMVSAIAIEISWRFDLGATRSGNRWYGMQAGAYLEGAEALAKIALRQDMQETKIDALNEEWAQESPPFPTDEGWVKGKLEDAQGRLNINLMKVKTNKLQGSVSQAERFTASQKRFIRLLQVIPIEPDVYLDMQTAIGIAEAVIDWLDPDDEVTGFGGAESDYYGSLDIPVTIRNNTMVSVSELRVIKGFNEVPALYEGLLPYIMALQPDAKLNINTASLPVLQSLNAKDVLRPLTVDEAQLILEDRGLDGKGFAQLDEFKNSHSVSNLMGSSNGQPNIDMTDLVLSSNYFLFFGETEVGEKIRRSRSVLRRENNDVITLRRTDANF